MGQFAALQLKHPDAQAELSTFIIASESQYCYVVVAEAFHESGSKFKTIKPGKIMRTWEDTPGYFDTIRMHSP
jgi:hypothetical protein